MKTITVRHSAGEYNIYVGSGILGDALQEALNGAQYDRHFLVSDSSVIALWGEHFRNEFEKTGKRLSGEYVFAAGERSKTLETVSGMYDAFTRAGLTRKSLVFALGGGVCGDMTGFAAATYLRGIDVMQIPTTLLSQIDSSIGGKTGVDLSVGKNLVGAFKQPMAVIADSCFLETLPSRYMNDGMGEAIKYGCIADRELFDGIADGTIDRTQMIYRCMKIKAQIVMEDEFETGIRAILNYGHTIGHAVEKLGGFERFSHGESVGIGMLYAARIGAKLGYDNTFEEKIRTALEKWSMPTDMDYPAAALFETACSDKKRTGDEIRFILLETIGKAAIVRLPIARLGEIL